MKTDKIYNQIKGGKADKLTAKDLARKHNVSIGTIEKEIEMGKKIEMEHTDDEDKAIEIAMDHIDEFVDYYSNKRAGLKASEKKLNKLALESFISIFNEVLSEEISKANTMGNPQNFEVNDEFIKVSDDAMEQLLELPFLSAKSFVRPKNYGSGGYNWILWTDWMEPEQYDQVAKILGFTY